MSPAIRLRRRLSLALLVTHTIVIVIVSHCCQHWLIAAITAAVNRRIRFSRHRMNHELLHIVIMLPSLLITPLLCYFAFNAVSYYDCSYYEFHCSLGLRPSATPTLLLLATLNIAWFHYGLLAIVGWLMNYYRLHLLLRYYHLISQEHYWSCSLITGLRFSHTPVAIVIIFSPTPLAGGFITSLFRHHLSHINI